MFCSRCGEQVDTSSRFCPRCGQDLTALTTGAGKPGATAAISSQPPQEDETAIVREALKDEYELEKELGRGGMAVVFKARDKQLEREVAIKVLPFSLSFDAEFVERFQREARTAGKLEHPNIIPIYRVGRSGRVIYFCMKFIRGKSLTAVIEARGAVPIVELKRVLIECARALGYAHKHGIVHRDIKPDNIMFDELGQAIVTDFGIAKAQSGAKLTGTGMSIGTPHYMSPEQARAQNLDGRSDIYSLGVVGYQCLTGHVPFDGEDSFSIGYKHIMEELPVPTLEQADQREMFGIIQKMMAKKPDDRFQNAEELVAALESGSAMPMADLASMPTRAFEPPKMPAPKKGAAAAPPPAIASAATTPLPRASASMGRPKDMPVGGGPAAPPAAKPALKPREAPKKKSSGGLMAAVILLALAGAGFGGYVMFMKNNPPPQVAATPAPPPVTHDSLTDSAKAAIAAPPDAAKQPDVAKRPAARRADDRKKADTSKRPTAQPTGTGTISLHGQPANSTVRVDGERKSGTPDRIKVSSGVPHQIEVESQGQVFSQTVTVGPNQTTGLEVHLRPAGGSTPSGTTTSSGGSAGPPAYCLSDPTRGKTNRNHECYDDRPAAQTSLSVAPPPSCSRTRPVSLLVKVNAQGEVEGTPTVVTPSGCREFDDIATQQIQDIQFRAAMKNRQPVASWSIVQMQPRAN